MSLFTILRVTPIPLWRITTTRLVNVRHHTLLHKFFYLWWKFLRFTLLATLIYATHLINYSQVLYITSPVCLVTKSCLTLCPNAIWKQTQSTDGSRCLNAQLPHPTDGVSQAVFAQAPELPQPQGPSVVADWQHHLALMFSLPCFSSPRRVWLSW